MSERYVGLDNVDGRPVTQNAPSSTNLGGSGSLQQANGTWTYVASPKLEGDTGVKVVVASATTTISRFSPNATNVQMFIGLGFRIEQLPTKTFHVFGSLRNSNGVAMRVFWDYLGRIGIRGTGVTTPEVFADNTLTVGKYYYMTILANATNNTVTVKFYDALTRALAATVSSSGAISIGTTAFNNFDFGWANSDPTTGHVAYFDTLILDDGRTTERFPNAWSAPVSLAGQMWDGLALQNGTLRSWDGSALSELAAVAIS
jgi:hypothetical protein